MAIITVLGAGMMGSALAVPLCDRGHRVRLVGTHLDGEIVASLQARRWHPTLRLELPATIEAFAVDALAEAMADVELVVLGVSSAGARWAGERIAPFARAGLPIAMITKGLCWDGAKLVTMPELVHGWLAESVRTAVVPAAVAGPCIAGELARRVPSCVVVTGRDAAMLEHIAALWRGPRYHVWTSTDVVGVEVCAALKNAYAMGVAFGAGMHLAAGGEPGSVAMHNVEAALFAQAVGEMRRVVERVGGNPDSAVGLAGVGDLDVTNNGGRTGRFGALLGQGLTVAEAVTRMGGATLECLEIIGVMRSATRAWLARGELEPGALPLLEHMAEVVLDGAPVRLPFERFFAAEPAP